MARRQIRSSIRRCRPQSRLSLQTKFSQLSRLERAGLLIRGTTGQKWRWLCVMTHDDVVKSAKAALNQLASDESVSCGQKVVELEEIRRDIDADVIALIHRMKCGG
jgi:hypothetical protein